MSVSVPASVVDAFCLSGQPVALAGGQGQTVRFDGVVIKPCDDPREASGLAEVMDALLVEGFRIAPPVRASGRRWVVEGWAASRFVAGLPGFAGREAEAVAACRAFHGALRRAYPHDVAPDWLTHRWDVWQHADAIAWGERDPSEFVPQESAVELASLQERLRPIDGLPYQITHGDPGGDNILFADGLTPAIIDISPYWRPAGYAVAMMLADGVAWEGSRVGVLELGCDEPCFGQLLLRACLYRLAVAALTRGAEGVCRRMEAYDAVLDWLDG